MLNDDSGVTGCFHISSWEVKFEELPEQIRSAFSKAEQETYKAGCAELVHRLIMTDEIELVRVASLIKATHPVHVYVEDLFNSPQVWFGVTCIKLAAQVRLQIPSGLDIGRFPPRLNKVFQSLGGLTSSIPFGPRLRVQKAQLPSTILREHDALEFYKIGNGDSMYCRRDGSVFNYSHETGVLQELTETDLNFEIGNFMKFVSEESATEKLLRSYRDLSPD